jgi:hypothetical protein
VAGVKAKVKVPVDEVFIVPGLHVPVIPFVEVSGNTGAAAF